MLAPMHDSPDSTAAAATATGAAWTGSATRPAIMRPAAAAPWQLILLALLLGPAGCSRTPAPALAAAGSSTPAGAVLAPMTPLTAADEAALRQRILDDASRTQQQLQSQHRHDTALFTAQENHRITLQSCGQRAGDAQLACRRQADADLAAAQAQIRATQRERIGRPMTAPQRRTQTGQAP